MDDVVRELGLLCLGSRLKRIGERLQADVQRHLDDAGIEAQPSNYPLLFTIDRYGALTIGDLAEALGVSQPGITRSVIKLAEQGVVEITRRDEDQRKKSVSLTTTGQSLVDKSREEVWPFIESALANLCQDKPLLLLDHLTAIEDALSVRPLDKRMTDQIKEAQK
jgi:DNA-binding MarR family transcriptional regulator